MTVLRFPRAAARVTVKPSSSPYRENVMMENLGTGDALRKCSTKFQC
jgi:hypothetical protein